MAEVKTAAPSEQEQTAPVALQVQASAEAADNSADENVEKDETGLSDDSKETQQSSDKEKELPEPIRPGDGKGMMPGLPPINITELTSMLRGPNMPSQRIMKEVADKMLLRSEESESDDGSVSSSGGGMGMKGLFDCIVEVTLLQNDSDNSDDDDQDESIPKEIPCTFCNKIFGSTMTWKTHVLVAHPNQDPSVLNIKHLSGNEADRREKGHPAYRKRSKGSSKSDCDIKDSKSRHASKTVSVEGPDGEENVPLGKRRGSLSRSHQKSAAHPKSEHKSRHAVQQGAKELAPGNTDSSSVTTVPAVKPNVEEGGQETTLSSASTPSSEKVKQSDQSSQEKKNVDQEKQQIQEEVIDLSVSSSRRPASETTPSDDCPSSKKKRTGSSQEDSSSATASVTSSSSPDPKTTSQSSDTSVSEESTTSRKRKHTDSSTTEGTKKTRRGKAKTNTEKTSSTPTRRSSRRH